jgi:hypothetical protein
MDEELRRAIEENRPVKVGPLARAAGFSPKTIYKSIGRGEIRAARVGRGVRVLPDDARRVLGLTAA